MTTASAFVCAGAIVGRAATAPFSPPSQQTAPPAQTTPATPGSRSALDGVYSAAQAKRGQDVFSANCAKCHGASAEGGESAPELVGPAFIADWNGMTVGDLVERTRTTMPDGNSGSLTRQQYTDVVTYILSVNRYPSGTSDLETDVAKQKMIKIEAIK